jgi:hypothetical protein
MKTNTLAPCPLTSLNIPNPESYLFSRERKDEKPSEEIIRNILNYSKALRIQPFSKCKGFLEYIAN